MNPINSKTNFKLSLTQANAPGADAIIRVNEDLTTDKTHNQNVIDYFKSIVNMTFSAQKGNTSEFEVKENDPTADANIVVGSDGVPELHLKSTAITGIPGKYVTVNVSSNKYPRQTVTGKLYDCVKFQPSDLTTTVQTDGIHVVSKTDDYLQKIENVRMRINRVGADDPKDFELNSYITKGNIKNNELKIPLTIDDLNAMNDGKGVDLSDDNSYWSYIDSVGYTSWWNHNSLSLNPIKFAAGVNAANETATPSGLDKLDELAKNLENGYVVKSDEMIDPTHQGVVINGAIAGAIATNNTDRVPDFSDINTCAGDVTVNRTVTEVDDQIKMEIIDHSKLENVTDTGRKFGISITRDTEQIYQLPFSAELRFDLPEDLEVHTGQMIYLISRHEVDGRVTYPRYSVYVRNDGEKKYGVAYVDQYSDFVLVTADEVKPAPTPAPSKKESSSGSSTPKKDNVVTCQMAGYPANYAWNESVKACQPGYLDNNGVFHLTTGNTNKRVGVVNTSDKGIGGTITALISSTIAAIAAAYALKKWN